MFVELDKWGKEVIKNIPEGIEKPGIREIVKFHEYVSVDELIQTISDLNDEIERLSDLFEKVDKECQVAFKNTSKVILNKEFLNLIESVEDELDTTYLEDENEGIIDVEKMYCLVNDLYENYLDKKEELRSN